eukprot:TRINITY_DN13746_c0_g1_i1.p1 TRINITY_DN13746_c0_g1~~TRINITY_DN13746_c0_g1_i1.p1  ORF type:complete len:174 (-),score=1.16 TRINITY_DN13746_c0_g1_i1:92-613(-)
MISKYCTNPDLVQPLGQPYIIHMSDLVKLAPLWVELTYKLRLERIEGAKDGKRTEYADMWGYVIAAANLGLTHTILPLVTQPFRYIQFNPKAYLIHYTYGLTVPDTPWSFNKRDTFPNRFWTHLIPTPPDGASTSVKVFIDVLNEALERLYHLPPAPPSANTSTVRPLINVYR